MVYLYTEYRGNKSCDIERYQSYIEAARIAQMRLDHMRFFEKLKIKNMYIKTFNGHLTNLKGDLKA